MFYRLPAEFDLVISCFWLIYLLLPPTMWRLSGLCWSWEDGGLLFSREALTCSFNILPVVLPDCWIANRASFGCIRSCFRFLKLPLSALFVGLCPGRFSPSNADISWLLDGLDYGLIGSIAVALAEFWMVWAWVAVPFFFWTLPFERLLLEDCLPCGSRSSFLYALNSLSFLSTFDVTSWWEPLRCWGGRLSGVATLWACIQVWGSTNFCLCGGLACACRVLLSFLERAWRSSCSMMKLSSSTDWSCLIESRMLSLVLGYAVRLD